MSTTGLRPPHKRNSSGTSSRYSSKSSDMQFASPPTPSTSRAKTASKIMTSVRRTIAVSQSTSRRHKDEDRSPRRFPPFETFEETRLWHQESAAARPTVEQIALGLHRSRTPHLRQGNPSHNPYINSPPPHHRSNSFEGIRAKPTNSHSPSPTRSVMKKAHDPSSRSPALTSASASSATTSNGPSTPRSNRSLASLKLRMSKMLPGASSSTLSSVSSLTPSKNDLRPPARKAVRFHDAS